MRSIIFLLILSSCGGSMSGTFSKKTAPVRRAAYLTENSKIVIVNLLTGKKTLPPLNNSIGGGGSIHKGHSYPFLSPNGRFLAYINSKGRPELYEIAGSKRLDNLFKGVPAPGEANYLFAGWSPDSRYLLLHVSQSYGMEPGPAVKNPGFYLFDLKPGKTHYLKALKNAGYRDWCPGSENRILLSLSDRGGLFFYNLKTGKLKKYLTLKSPMSQLNMGTENQLAFAYNKGNGGKSWIGIVGPEGLRLSTRMLTPRGEYPQYQWPKWINNGSYIAYVERIKGNKKKLILCRPDGKNKQAIARGEIARFKGVGKYLVYNIKSKLYVYNTNTKKSRLLTVDFFVMND